MKIWSKEGMKIGNEEGMKIGNKERRKRWNKRKIRRNKKTGKKKKYENKLLKGNNYYWLLLCVAHRSEVAYSPFYYEVITHLSTEQALLLNFFLSFSLRSTKHCLMWHTGLNNKRGCIQPKCSLTTKLNPEWKYSSLTIKLFIVSYRILQLSSNQVVWALVGWLECNLDSYKY